MHNNHELRPYLGSSLDKYRRRYCNVNNVPAEEKIVLLLSKDLERCGDLGWTLNYATAYAYRCIVGARTEIKDAFDRIREVGQISRQTPYFMFDKLDRAIFRGKLHGMVHLRWKAQADNAPGTTYAPHKGGVPRICIELNSTPFEEDDCGIDDLLDALIHHMIHAWFLVCCGAQKEGGANDGRIDDGLHFGVLLSTIRDLARQCKHGPLRLIFYVAERDDQYAYMSSPYATNDRKDLFIALDPRGDATGLPLADGKSHCTLDNRRVSFAQLKDWQVSGYSKAIDENREAMGTDVYDLKLSTELMATKRLHGPPSNTYLELIWDKKRIMIPNEKAIKLDSLRKIVEKIESQGRDVKVPECPFKVLLHVYDFIMKGGYWKYPEETPRNNDLPQYSTSSRGPPVLVGRASDPEERLATHVRVCRTAETMRFEELRKYALQRLNDMPMTTGDPMPALRQIYDPDKPSAHSELQHWARRFLLRTDDYDPGRDDDSLLPHARRNTFRRRGVGPSNFEKIQEWHPDAINELRFKSQAFRDDVDLICSKLNDLGRIPDSSPGKDGRWHTPDGLSSDLPIRDDWRQRQRDGRYAGDSWRRVRDSDTLGELDVRARRLQLEDRRERSLEREFDPWERVPGASARTRNPAYSRRRSPSPNFY